MKLNNTNLGKKVLVFEQMVKKEVTIVAGATGSVSVPAPQDQDIVLKGYAYDWFTLNKFKLRTDNITMPVRTDQEGSISQPRLFEYGLPVRKGSNCSLSITNNDATDHTYQVMFIFLVSTVMQGSAYESVGNAILLATEGAGSTGVVTPTSIFDSTGTTVASVTAKGLQTETNAPATLKSGTIATTAATSVALASTSALKKGVLVQADYGNTDYLLVGNATTQLQRMYAGDSIYFDIDDLAKVHIKRPASVDGTVNFVGS